MISDLDETIREILKDGLPIHNGEIDVAFYQPKREWSAKLNRPTINLFLYDVRENAQLRRHQWEQMANGNGRLDQVSMKRSPFRVDCFYMITAWAVEPGDEHRLLTRTLLALFRHPTLPEELMVGQMKQQPYEVQAAVARHDRLTNPAEVWSALDNEMRPTVSYVVTLALDPWREVSGPIIRSVFMRTGLAKELPKERQLLEDTPFSEMVVIGGTVRKGEVGQAGVNVSILNHDLVDKTDDEGRFKLGSLPPGKYTLVAQPEKEKSVKKQITIKAGEAEDYDLSM
jgi:hypothetical protein